MKNSKAQVDIVSAILIVLIALGLTATAYTWGLPLIQRRQDTAVLERITSHFDQNNVNSLPSRIEFIANNGGEQAFTIDANGVWLVNPCSKDELAACNPSPAVASSESNSLQFAFFSKASNVATQTGFISLTPGASCPPSAGILGKDKSSVVCAKATPVHDGFDITYKIRFRELEQPTASRGFKIDLTKHESGLYSSADKTIRISRQDIHQTSVAGKTLIIPEIKILLSGSGSSIPLESMSITTIQINADFEGYYYVPSGKCWDDQGIIAAGHNGLGNLRAYIRFPLARLPPDAKIVDAKLLIEVLGNLNPVLDIQAYDKDGLADPAADACADRFIRAGNDNSPYVDNTNAFSTTGAVSVQLPAEANSDIERAISAGRFSLAIKENTVNSYAQFETFGNKPKLVIAYISAMPAIPDQPPTPAPNLVWFQTNNPSIQDDTPNSVAVDSTGIYVAGYDFNGAGPNVNSQWRIEKRNLNDGSLIWTQINNPSNGGDTANGVAIDGTGIYVVGHESLPQAILGEANSQWRIEKRRLDDGSLVWAQASNPAGSFDQANGIAVDNTGIYVVGYDTTAFSPDSEWRIEKRSLSDGSLIWEQTENLNNRQFQTSGLEDAATAVAVDSTGIYIVGYNQRFGQYIWRIEKRRLDDGSRIWTSPGLYGGIPYAVAVDSTGLYVVGDNAGSPGDRIYNGWFIRKINLNSGSLIWEQLSQPTSQDDTSKAVAVDGTGLYIAGYDSTIGNQWRIEKRNPNDGSLIWTQTENPTRSDDQAKGIAADSTGIYIVGYDRSTNNIDFNSQWRIEKRHLELITP